MDAIILGGSKDKYWFDEGVENKTLLKVNSLMIIEKILTALKGVNLNKVILTGDLSVPVNVRNMADLFVSGGEIWEKITKAINLTDTDNFILISGDIPLITKEVLQESITIYHNYNCDVLFFVVAKDSVVRKYPKFKKSYFYLDGKECKIGNIFFFNRNSYVVLEKMVIPLIKTRKSLLPISYLKIAGLSLTFKYFFRAISIKEVEERIEEITNLKLKILFFEHPEIALDVDRKKDLNAVREILNFS